MGSVFYGLRRGAEYLVSPFDRLTPTAGLVVIALLTAVVMVLVIGKVTPQARIKRARNGLTSAIYEIRLFLDSPVRVFAAQGRLLWSGLLYTFYLGPAFLVLTLPLGLLFLDLEARHGIDPLAEGATAVVQVELNSSVDGYSVEAGDLPDGLAVTAPPLVDAASGKVYLRVATKAAGLHELPIRLGGEVVSKEIAVGPQDKVTPERVRGAGVLWAVGLEAPIASSSPVQSISVDYPDADQSWWGLGVPWWLFWLVLAMVFALIVRRPLRVEL